MPTCGSQVVLCDIPIRFDTYKGCEHGCLYCFAQRKRDISEVLVDESPESLDRFCKGHRSKITMWADWDIPLHWGGMSDPFQPAEAIHKRSLACLKVLADNNYPFVVSTKGKIIAEPEYLELISKCNAVVQISLACPDYDKYEPNAPTFNERLAMCEKLAPKSKRLIIRIQPYIIDHHQAIMDSLGLFKQAGVYGVVVEGIKMMKKHKGFIRHFGDMVYPAPLLKPKLLEIKHKAHDLGLKFYSGENRFRKMGDSLCCCGCADLDGFKVNTYNLNHNMLRPEPTQGMKSKGSGACFRTLAQASVKVKTVDSKPYNELMDAIANDKSYSKILTPEQ